MCISCTHGADEPTVIRVLGEDSSNVRAMKALAPEFSQRLLAQGHNVHVDFTALAFDDAQKRADRMFSQKSSEFDIVLQYNFSLASYAGHDYVMRARDLTPLVPHGQPDQVGKSLYESVWKEVGWYYRQGTRSDEAIEAIGYPFAANTMLLVYNKRFFDDPALQRAYRAKYDAELRPPQRWDELKREADFFKTSSSAHCGIALEGKSEAWLYYEWMNFLFGYGGKVMDKKYGWQGNLDTKLNLNTPVAIAAANAHHALKPDTCGDFFSMDAPAQREKLLQGNVPMAIMWSDYLFELAHGKAQRNSSFGYAPVPGDKSMIAGGSYYINKRSAHPDYAAQFVFFLLEPENQARLVKQGLCSPLRSIYEHPERFPEAPYLGALGDSLNRGTYMLEAGPDSTVISSEIEKSLSRIWRGAPIQPTLDTLEESLPAKRAEAFRKADANRT